jgi:hypothetical protein
MKRDIVVSNYVCRVATQKLTERQEKKKVRWGQAPTDSEGAFNNLT